VALLDHLPVVVTMMEELPLVIAMAALPEVSTPAALPDKFALAALQLHWVFCRRLLHCAGSSAEVFYCSGCSGPWPFVVPGGGTWCTTGSCGTLCQWYNPTELRSDDGAKHPLIMLRFYGLFLDLCVRGNPTKFLGLRARSGNPQSFRASVSVVARVPI
jgi:hypothetical protein